MATLVALLGPTAWAQPVQFDDFVDVSGLTLNGMAGSLTSSANGILRLTYDVNEGGSAFLTDRVALGPQGSFSTHFAFRLSDAQGNPDADGPGADGMVFVIQTEGATALGGIGADIGYTGIAPSFAVEVDTWDNEQQDGFNGNHIGINLNGNITSVARASIAKRMNDGDLLFLWVDYDGSTRTAEVRLSESPARPASPTLSRVVNLPTLLGTTQVFAGFTSGTGSASNDHDILYWFLKDKYAPIEADVRFVERRVFCEDPTYEVRLTGDGVGDPAETVHVTEVLTTVSGNGSNAALITIEDVSNGGAVNDVSSPDRTEPSITVFPNRIFVGTDCLGGSNTVDNGDGTYTSTSTSGGDIWDVGDDFEFRHAEVTGDFDISVEMTGYSHSSGIGRWGKFGLMARQSDGNPTSERFSRFIMVEANGPVNDPARVLARHRHNGVGGGTMSETNFPGVSARPRFLRLTRRGTQLQGWASDNPGLGDGTLNPCNDAHWMAGRIDDWGPGMPNTLLVGLANSEHTDLGCGVQSMVFRPLARVTGLPLPLLRKEISWDVARAALDGDLVYSASYPSEGQARFSGLVSASGPNLIRGVDRLFLDGVDADGDGDGVGNACDNCPTVANSGQTDVDDDLVGGVCDNCPSVANGAQTDTDGDGLGNACDPDDDGDGVADGLDNCPFRVNPDQTDTDNDDLGNICDPDDDGDGVADGLDNCPGVANASQADVDDDDLGDACDPHDDRLRMRIDAIAPAGSIDSETTSLVTWKVPGLAGETVAVTAEVSMVLDLPGEGPQGWSLSVRTDGCFNISSATIAGTVAGGLFTASGFTSTRVVDPAKNGGQEGAVSAVVLDTKTGAAMLPPEGESGILRITGEIDLAGVPVGGETSPCHLEVVPSGETGLSNGGAPFNAVVTLQGQSHPVDAIVDLDVIAVATPPNFRRGDANADGCVYLDDAVWIVNQLLRGGPAAPCADAADSNDDGGLDVSDSIFLTSWILLGGSAPHAPGPSACGPDPSPDGNECDVYPGGCGPPPVRPPGPTTTLALVNPGSPPGATFDVHVRMSSQSAVQALSFGVEATGARLVDLFAAGAAADVDLVRRQIIDAGGTRAVGSVLVDTNGFGPAGFPPGSNVHVFTLRFETPAEPCGAVSVRFRDGLQGTGQAIENLVTIGGLGFRPTLSGLTIPMAPEPVALGVPEGASVAACRLFRVDPPFAGALVVTIEDSDPLDANALYFRWGSPPTASLFDHAADERGRPEQRLVVPAVRGEPAYLLVLANVPNGGSSDIMLLVEEADLALEGMSATSSRGGTGTLIHASILGSGFQPSTRFALEPTAGGASRGALDADIVSSSRAEAVFDLTGLAPGLHDLVAETTELAQSARLDDAFTIAPTSAGPRLEVSFLGEEQGSRKFRYDRLSRLTLVYRNSGDEEMPAPLLKVVAPPGTQLRLARDEAFQEGEIQVLGIHPNGYPGWLPPGGGWEVPIEFQSTFCRNCPVSFQVHVLTPLPGDFVGWDTVPAPAGMSASNWALAWPGLSQVFGATWKEYLLGLGEIARRRAHRGEDPTSVLDTFRLAAREALGRPGSALTGSVHLLADGRPLAGGTVLALDGAAVASSAVIDGAGSFAIDWLEGGKTYRLALVGHRIAETSLGSVDVPVPAGGDVLGVEVVAAPEPNGLLPACPACDEAGLPTRPLLPPAALFALAAEWGAQIVSSWDPNDKDGPEGEDRDERMGLIRPDEPIEYTIHFENRPQAGAAAQEVVVTDFLPPALDPETVTLRQFQIASTPIELDITGADLSSGYTRNLAVESYEASGEAEVRLATGGMTIPVVFHSKLEQAATAVVAQAVAPGNVLRWTFTTEDLDGFLPPNCRTGCNCASLPVSGPDEDGCKDGRGEGSITFTVMPLPGTPEGTIVENRAEISFDGLPHEGEILRWVNEISYFLPPEVPASPEPPSGAGDVGPEVTLQWEDTGAVSYDLYVWRVGEARGAPLAAGITGESFTVEGLLPGERYVWQVVARDAGGAETPGPEWVFGTAEVRPCPPVPSGPSPADGATGILATTSFSWALSPPPEAGSVVYDLFLWRDGDPEPSEPLAQGFVLPRFPAAALEAGTRYRWRVAASHTGCRSEGPLWSFTTVGAETLFRRGDADSSGEVNLTDAIRVLNVLFLGIGSIACDDAADADSSGEVNLTDAIRILNVLFLGLGTIGPPGIDDCGPDPEPDNLACSQALCL